jgi:uncharacterized membrane protein YeaQ/YmgE (transglycosylase-associated protein family)
MGVISWIVIGLLAGWLAAKLTNSLRGLLRNIAVGLIGALLGGFLAQKLGIEVVPDFWGELVVAIVGAVILVFVLQAVRRAEAPVAAQRGHS